MWGRQDGRFGDYGVTNRAEFLAWGLKKYGSKDALCAAWGEYEGEIIPPPAVREPKNGKGQELCRDPKAGRWAVDYDRFVNECSVNAMEHFGKIIKEKTNDKPVGVFYGYIMHVARSGYAAHLGGWERVLARISTLLQRPSPTAAAAPESRVGKCAP